jgi:hypothetical protein
MSHYTSKKVLKYTLKMLHQNFTYLSLYFDREVIYTYYNTMILVTSIILATTNKKMKMRWKHPSILFLFE